MEDVKMEDREGQLDACRTVLRILMSRRHGPRNQYFLHPVDPVALDVPDYFTIVEHPMDLGTIKTKLDNNLYTGARDFEQDVRLVFANCYKFNSKGHEVSKAGHELEEVFNIHWQKHLSTQSSARVNNINSQAKSPGIRASGDVSQMQGLEQHFPAPEDRLPRERSLRRFHSTPATFNAPKPPSRVNNLARTSERSNPRMSPADRLRTEEIIPLKEEPKSDEDSNDDSSVSEAPHSVEGFEKGTYAVFDAGVTKLLGVVTDNVTKLRRSRVEEEHTCCKFQLVDHLGTVDKTMILDVEDLTETRYQMGDNIPMSINVGRQEMRIEAEVLAIKMVDGVVHYDVEVHDQTITVSEDDLD